MTVLSTYYGTQTGEIASTPTVLQCRAKFVDSKGKFAIKTWHIDGAATDTQILDMFYDLTGASNAGIVKASAGERDVVGLNDLATNAVQNTVKNFLSLVFSQVDPLNPAKIVTRSFLIPSYKDDIDNAGAVSRDVTALGSAAVDALITYLTGALAFQDHAGTWRIGGWTYQASESGFGASGGEIG
jgi:hypothetical protein